MKITSKYKGVSWVTKRQKWQATIRYNNFSHTLGYFATEEEAVKARDRRIIALGLDVELQKFKKL